MIHCACNEPDCKNKVWLVPNINGATLNIEHNRLKPEVGSSLKRCGMIPELSMHLNRDDLLTLIRHATNALANKSHKPNRIYLNQIEQALNALKIT